MIRDPEEVQGLCRHLVPIVILRVYFTENEHSARCLIKTRADINFEHIKRRVRKEMPSVDPKGTMLFKLKVGADRSRTSWIFGSDTPKTVSIWWIFYPKKPAS